MPPCFPIRRCREAGLPKPVFSLDDGFRIALGRPTPVDATQDTEQIPREPRRPRELAQVLQLRNDGVSYHLKKLRAEGSIRHEGPTKAGRWIVNPPTQQETP
jgi:ATP-dependent DNA helicase RecG